MAEEENATQAAADRSASRWKGWLLLLLLLGLRWWREKRFAEKRGGEREALQASVKLLGEGWDALFQVEDGGEVSGGD